MEENQTEQAPAPDWKHIAFQLAQRVNFAVTNCKATGGMYNTKTGQITSWREYMAEALEMIPGTTVDREMLATYELPPAKRRKAQKELREERKKSEA
ncbi:hypothetical protein [Paracidovorax citrulli]|uniref:Transcriptional regulator n=1 Tax=Paracidovorax citrulli TaxID=80869 RepID=A0ABY9AL15_PARCI|nr:hypothetical protein [Paracidovorax citrulli]MVT30081.1 hypothetical protein [Paracidovorax citrulli]MVT30121.1 hypothetical protein [Paracidovorax citrulli]MVT38547.1 hypothetical protein [Paracidovorax citrulli]PVY66472.1 hypothetical protein C8E08_3880 [Paracidovorax citrulli]QCX12148.1 hypothetical protein APS58_3388 [Paracidovorax citrulli]